MQHWSIFFKRFHTTDSMMTIGNVKIRNISHMLFVSELSCRQLDQLVPFKYAVNGKPGTGWLTSRLGRTRSDEETSVFLTPGTGRKEVVLLIKVPRV